MVQRSDQGSNELERMVLIWLLSGQSRTAPANGHFVKFVDGIGKFRDVNREPSSSIGEIDGPRKVQGVFFGRRNEKKQTSWTANLTGECRSYQMWVQRRNGRRIWWKPKGRYITGALVERRRLKGTGMLCGRRSKIVSGRGSVITRGRSGT